MTLSAAFWTLSAWALLALVTGLLLGPMMSGDERRDARRRDDACPRTRTPADVPQQRCSPERESAAERPAAASVSG